jgi:hypothetical protein
MKYKYADTEKLLALTMIGIASYMLVGSFSFPGRVSTFPQLTAAVVIVGSFLVIFQDYLPMPLRKAVADTSALIEADEDKIPETDKQIDEDGSDESENLEDGKLYVKYKPLITFTLLALYLAASYLFGFLLVSPLFVGAYTLITRQPWYVVITTSVLAFVIVFIFMVVLNVPVDRGIVFPGVTW